MYIDTTSKESMLKSLAKYLNISEEKLIKKLNNIFTNNRNDYESEIRQLISSSNISEEIDKMQLFHLSSRLNSVTDNYKDTYNLEKLLLTENEFSKLLKSVSITFKKNKDCIELYYNNNLYKLNSEEYMGNGNIYRLKKRLGQNTKDYCINGFAIYYGIEDFNYTRNLSACPEFIEDLIVVINRRINLDYASKSTFYCYEYIISLDEIIFDGKENYSNEDKIYYLLEQVCLNIYNKLYNEDFIIRLDDDRNLSEKEFVNRNEMK